MMKMAELMTTMGHNPHADPVNGRFSPSLSSSLGAIHVIDGRAEWPCSSTVGCSILGCLFPVSPPVMAGPITNVESENIPAMTASAIVGATQVPKRW